MSRISIVGDSISTFQGYNPKGYDVFYDEEKCTINGITSVKDTWWHKVISARKSRLCVNNAYSGSRVSGKTNQSARSDARTSLLHRTFLKPDLILIYIGFNDFGNGIPIRKPGAVGTGDSFYESYIDMLGKIKRNYPKSRIVCATLLRTVVKDEPDFIFPEKWQGVAFEDYNNAIRDAVKEMNVELADLAETGIKYETLDGTHPTVSGHNTIAKVWLECI